MMPGVPAAGHLTRGGFWHPGRAEGCAKCEPEPPPTCEAESDFGGGCLLPPGHNGWHQAHGRSWGDRE